MTRRAARASFPPCKFLQILINRRSVAKRFRSGCWFSHWGKRARFPEGWKENAIARVERDCEKNLDCEIFPFSSNSKDRTVFNTRLKKQFGIEKEEGAYWIYFTTERLVSFDTLSSRRLIALPKSSTDFAGGAIFVDPLPVKRQQNLLVLIIPTKSLLSFFPLFSRYKNRIQKKGKLASIYSTLFPRIFFYCSTRAKERFAPRPTNNASLCSSAFRPRRRWTTGARGGGIDDFLFLTFD